MTEMSNIRLFICLLIASVARMASATECVLILGAGATAKPVWTLVPLRSGAWRETAEGAMDTLTPAGLLEWIVRPALGNKEVLVEGRLLERFRGEAESTLKVPATDATPGTLVRYSIQRLENAIKEKPLTLRLQLSALSLTSVGRAAFAGNPGAFALVSAPKNARRELVILTNALLANDKFRLKVSATDTEIAKAWESYIVRAAPSETKIRSLEADGSRGIIWFDVPDEQVDLFVRSVPMIDEGR